MEFFIGMCVGASIVLALWLHRDAIIHKELMEIKHDVEDAQKELNDLIRDIEIKDKHVS